MQRSPAPEERRQGVPADGQRSARPHRPPLRGSPLLHRAFAWTGAAIFAASLLYFLFSYGVTFRETAPAPLEPDALAANIALFTVFALHHSLFARTPIRNLVRRMVPPQLERSCYVWVASLMLIGVCRFWQPLPGIAWQVPAAFLWLPPVMLVTGMWVTLRSAAILDIWELAGVRQLQTPNCNLQTPKLPADACLELGVGSVEFETKGPYRWVRHPIYLGWFLLVFGVGTMTMTRLAFAVISGVYILIAIPLEEGTLRRTAPDTYGEYMRKVRWKLVPYVY